MRAIGPLMIKLVQSNTHKEGRKFTTLQEIRILQEIQLDIKRIIRLYEKYSTVQFVILLS